MQDDSCLFFDRSAICSKALRSSSFLPNRCIRAWLRKCISGISSIIKSTNSSSSIGTSSTGYYRPVSLYHNSNQWKTRHNVNFFCRTADVIPFSTADGQTSLSRLSIRALTSPNVLVSKGTIVSSPFQLHVYQDAHIIVVQAVHSLDELKLPSPVLK